MASAAKVIVCLSCSSSVTLRKCLAVFTYLYIYTKINLVLAFLSESGNALARSLAGVNTGMESFMWGGGRWDLIVFIFDQMVIRLWIWTPVPGQWQNQCNLSILIPWFFSPVNPIINWNFVISSPHNQTQGLHHFLVSSIQCFLILSNLVLHACFCININKWF